MAFVGGWCNTNHEKKWVQFKQNDSSLIHWLIQLNEWRVIHISKELWNHCFTLQVMESLNNQPANWLFHLPTLLQFGQVFHLLQNLKVCIEVHLANPFFVSNQMSFKLFMICWGLGCVNHCFSCGDFCSMINLCLQPTWKTHVNPNLQAISLECLIEKCPSDLMSNKHKILTAAGATCHWLATCKRGKTHSTASICHSIFHTGNWLMIVLVAFIDQAIDAFIGAPLIVHWLNIVIDSLNHALNHPLISSKCS